MVHIFGGREVIQGHTVGLLFPRVGGVGVVRCLTPGDVVNPGIEIKVLRDGMRWLVQ